MSVSKAAVSVSEKKHETGARIAKSGDFATLLIIGTTLAR
jgi:hypothetical protein